MSRETSCPNKQDLERLMLGQLPDSDTARLASHIESCDQCVEAVRTLIPDDTLVAAMKHSLAVAADLPADEQVQSLIEHVCSLVGQPSAAETTAASSPGTPALSPSSPHAQTTIAGDNLGAESNSEVYDFLAPPQSPDELGRLGSYRVLKVLGSGGMGVVFLAEDTHLERKVALKAMKPWLASSESAKKRFLREARAAAAIEHDHIIGVFQVGEDRGVPYLAMPLLRGESLEERLNREGKLSVEEALRIGREIAEGLAVAHDRGLMHRDIKPGNVWLETKAEGRSSDAGSSSLVSPPSSFHRVRILDFGLARAADDASNLTQSGAIAGTPAYMAPEQAQDETVDQRCDLFSLGCVLYRCVTGLPPFQGKNPMAVLMAVTQTQPKPLRELDESLPVEVEKLISRLLEKNPANRFQTAHEVITEIRQIERQLAAKKPELGPAIATLTPPPEAVRPSSSSVPPRMTQADRPLESARTAPSVGQPRWRKVVIAAGALFALLLAGVVYQIQTSKGTLVVVIEDDAIEAKLKQSGLVIQDTTSGRSFTITTRGEQRERPGAYKLADDQALTLFVAENDGLEVATNEFKLTRGGKVRVRVTSELPAVASRVQPSASSSSDTDHAERKFRNSLGMEFVLIPKGKAWLGGGGAKVGDKEVEFKEDFYLGVYEVTQEEWEKVTGVNPSQFRRGGPLQSNIANVSDNDLKRFPVEWVGWDDAQDFLDVLNKRLNETGWIYRLPTEAEWEYACRGGPSSNKFTYAYHFYVDKATNTLGADQANCLFDGKGLKRPCKVGSYKPNPLGLHDMHGNVYEWCNDIHKATEAEIKQLGVAEGRAIRGGSWNADSGNCTATTRSWYPETGNYRRRREFLGLRVARVRAAVDANRRTAKAMLEFGDVTVSVGGQLRRIGKDDALPADNFRIEEIFVAERDRATDGDLEVLRGLTSLRAIELLDAPRVTDAGVAHLRDLPRLEKLSLPNTQLTDAGLEHIQGMPNLQELFLAGTQVSDAGLAHLRGLSQLVLLDVGLTRITDAGTVHLRELAGLRDLRLNDNKLSDAGLANIKVLSRLRNLSLSNTAVTSAGLEHLADLKELEHLLLNRTQLTDEGLKHLKKLVRLRQLWLHDTAVTDAGLAALGPLTNLEDLILAHTRGITDAGLEQLKGLTELRWLNLSDALVTDVGLEQLRELKKLESLSLERTKVTTAGVQRLRAALPKCKILH